MFWDSVHSALKVMTHWETHFVVLEYLLLMLTPVILIFLILKKRHALSIQYFRKLFLPIMEAIAIAVSVLTLFPIILGVGEHVAWNFPLRIMQLSPGGFLALIGSLIALAYLIDVIPQLRTLRSVKTLVLGGVCLIFVRIFLNLLNPVIDIEVMDLVPGFWFICGIIIISGVLAKLGYFVFVSFVNVLGSKFDLREEVAELLILPVIATLGFLPVFVYGAWLA
ncbi:MAG: hypothetical protein AMK71_00965 [Nitrospira bacterium SG8_35_4]|nr:MAG: hypothetical protein AMK71_00965 [Nitrospira bacterium SG8_35_4]